jgi:hypothetical protein
MWLTRRLHCDRYDSRRCESVHMTSFALSPEQRLELLKNFVRQSDKNEALRSEGSNLTNLLKAGKSPR